MNEKNLFDVMEQMGLSREEATQLMLKSLVDSLTKKEQKPETKKVTRTSVPNFERFLLALYDETNAFDWGNGKPSETDMKRILKRTHLTSSRSVADEKYGEFARLIVNALPMCDNSDELKYWIVETFKEEG